VSLFPHGCGDVIDVGDGVLPTHGSPSLCEDVIKPISPVRSYRIGEMST
jgi:hypothetical protein